MRNEMTLEEYLKSNTFINDINIYVYGEIIMSGVDVNAIMSNFLYNTYKNYIVMSEIKGVSATNIHICV